MLFSNQFLPLEISVFFWQNFARTKILPAFLKRCSQEALLAASV
jgi:hypothetical protein